MTEQKKPAHWPPDSDLNARAVLVVGIGLLLATALAAAAVWWLSVALRDTLAAEDPPPPILSEAQAPHVPPGPRVEVDPAALLRTLRAEENALLETYGWVDETSDVVRVPIERGMELLLETRPDGRAFGAQSTADSELPSTSGSGGAP